MANSPYNLTGNLAINKSVTLTVEAGTVVNLNGYYIQVNGTLIAKGSNSNNIQFNLGSIYFTSLSASWDEQTQSGSTLENCLVDSLNFTKSSPRLINDTINGNIDARLSSLTFSNFTIKAMTASNCSLQLYNGRFLRELGVSNSSLLLDSCTLNGLSSYRNILTITNCIGNASASEERLTLTNSILNGDIGGGTSCSIQNNVISGTIVVGNYSIVKNNSVAGRYITARCFCTISGNTVPNGDIVVNNNSNITGNIVTGGVRGESIRYALAYVTMSNNTIAGPIFYGNSNDGSSYNVLLNVTNNTLLGGKYSETSRIPPNSSFTGNSVWSVGAKFGNYSIVSENLFINNSLAVSGTPSIVQNNLFFNNTCAVNAASIVQNNTFALNAIAVKGANSLIYNNFENNAENIHLVSAADYNASYNWWGTTDVQAINQSMFDFKKDFNLGIVNFLPFLTEPNPAAPPVPPAPEPPSSPSPNPTPTVSPSPTPTPTATPTESPTPTVPPTTPTPSASPTSTPTEPTPSPSPTQTPTPEATASPTQTPSPSPTETSTPTTTPTQKQSSTPTQTPSSTPTQTPSSEPTETSTSTPSASPAESEPSQTSNPTSSLSSFDLVLLVVAVFALVVAAVALVYARRAVEGVAARSGDKK